MSRLVALVLSVVLFFTGAAALAGAAWVDQQSPQAQSPSPPSAEELDRLLASIALYPDRLLGQMLLCATTPAKVGALGEWLATKEGLNGSELQDAAVIEPANPQVVYVPQYNPQTVYTQPTTSTVVVQEDDDSDAVAAGLIGFGVGVAMGAAIDNDYYYGPYGWGGGYHMYDDAWDDWYDAREDARKDWADHREDFAEDRGELAEERGERAREQTEQRTEQRTDRQQTRQENRPETQAAREQRRTDAQQAATQARSTGTTQEARGYSGDGERVTRERSGTDSSAFSGYSSGRSERAASSRGQRSRSAGGGGGGGRRR
jgi:hypothetical protein